MNNFLPETMRRNRVFLILTASLLCLPLTTAYSADKAATDVEKTETKSAEETLAGRCDV